MPVDDALPPSRLPLDADTQAMRSHFLAHSSLRVDAEELEELPARVRLRLQGARSLESPEAVLLDRVLQLVPRPLLSAVNRIVVVPTRGVARLGGFLDGVVYLSASEADVRRPDVEYGGQFSVFTTTVLHEIGHAVFEGVLTDTQRDIVLDDYVRTLDSFGTVSADEPSVLGTQHHFISFLLPTLLGYGRLPRSAGAARRKVASFGLDIAQR